MNVRNFSMIFTLLWLSGCAYQSGDLVTKSHFIFPNSNLDTGNTVSVSMQKEGFGLSIGITSEDINGLLRKARKKSGADAIVDYRIDTKITDFIVYQKVDITISGVPVNMDIGEHKFKEEYKSMDYY